MDLNKIKYFHAIYQAQGITDAAKTLGITKAALSLNLKQLEQDFKTSLFVRANKKMLPTADAQVLYEKTKPIYSELDQTFDSIINPETKFSGTMRIGSPICFGSDLLSPFLKKFLSQNSQMKVDLTLEEGANILKRLELGQLDYAIVGEEILKKLPRSIYMQKLYSYELVMTCSPSLLNQYKLTKSPSQKQLLSLPMISLNHISSKDWFKLHFKSHTEMEKNRLNLNNHHAHIRCLRDSLGIGLQSSHSIKKYVKKGDLIEIRPTKKKLIYHFYGIQYYNSIPTKLIKSFSSYFQDYLLKH